MTGFTRKFYSPFLLDAMFTLMGLSSFVVLVFGPGDGAEAIAPAEEPLLRGIVLVAMLLGTALLASMGARLDQKCADDYVFMTMAKSALIGMATIVVLLVFWDLLFSGNLGALTGEDVFLIVLGSWACGYFYTRVRGTVA